VQFECGLVQPLGVNGEFQWFAQGLKCPDAQAAWLRPGGIEHAEKLAAEVHLIARHRTKPDEKVNGHAG